jgi:uncharacterized protein YfaS (alpha-2-macroglobulin family)
LLICEMPAPATGNLIVRAQAADAAGRAVVTRADAWVAAADDQWLAPSDNDRIDLLPEKKRYEPGATARFQVRTPFREATTLVTLEREGVLDAFVTEGGPGQPGARRAAQGPYAPNVFVSALLVRGRVGDAPPTAMVDLAKPSFRMGLAEVRVGWTAHELAVKVCRAARHVPHARQGAGDDRRAPSGRQRAAGRHRDRARRRRRGLLELLAEHVVEAARRDDGAPRRGGRDRRPRRCR